MIDITEQNQIFKTEENYITATSNKVNQHQQKRVKSTNPEIPSNYKQQLINNNINTNNKSNKVRENSYNSNRNARSIPQKVNYPENIKPTPIDYNNVITNIINTNSNEVQIEKNKAKNLNKRH